MKTETLHTSVVCVAIPATCGRRLYPGTLAIRGCTSQLWLCVLKSHQMPPLCMHSSRQTLFQIRWLTEREVCSRLGQQSVGMFPAFDVGSHVLTHALHAADKTRGKQKNSPTGTISKFEPTVGRLLRSISSILRPWRTAHTTNTSSRHARSRSHGQQQRKAVQ